MPFRSPGRYTTIWFPNNAPFGWHLIGPRPRTVKQIRFRRNWTAGWPQPQFILPVMNLVSNTHHWAEKSSQSWPCEHMAHRTFGCVPSKSVSCLRMMLYSYLAK